MPDVALFVTCMVDNLTPNVGVATVKLLEAAGCSVTFPEAQSCCGQPAVNSGEPEAASALARHFVEVFEPFDAVVSPSGSCAAMVRHWYPQLLDGAWKPRADAVAARTHELSSYLVDVLGCTDLGARVQSRVTVHDACHALRVLGLKSAPRRLLEAAGAEVVEMSEPEICCGFGGTFAEKHPEISGPMADDKLAQAAATDADVLTAGDTGCLLHLEGRRRRSGVGPPAVHFAEILARGLEP
ncbi:MAG TPA: (Fe-S)-binding protein [Acidimicrobiia bacterium]|nr:(Fe-S)-binding protein [Acidimicrobiia bacterium]